MRAHPRTGPRPRAHAHPHTHPRPHAHTPTRARTYAHPRRAARQEGESMSPLCQRVGVGLFQTDTRHLINTHDTRVRM